MSNKRRARNRRPVPVLTEVPIPEQPTQDEIARDAIDRALRDYEYAIIGIFVQQRAGIPESISGEEAAELAVVATKGCEARILAALGLPQALPIPADDVDFAGPVNINDVDCDEELTGPRGFFARVFGRPTLPGALGQ